MTTPNIKLFVSDMDSTMIQNECIDEMAWTLDEKRGTGEQYYAQVSAITKQAMDEGKDFSWSLNTRIGILVEAGFEEVWLPEIMVRITPQPDAKELLAHLNAHGVQTVLVSGGFTYFAHQVAHNLGFKQVFANELLFDRGKLVGVRGPQEILDGGIVDGKAKLTITQAIANQTHIDPAQICAIGDGSNDAQMVAFAGYGIAYYGKNKTLLAASSHQTESLAEVVGIVGGKSR